MTRTVLLTGGTGYIGSHICVELISSGFDVVLLDDLSNSDISVVERIRMITGGTRPTFWYGSTLDTGLLEQVFSRHPIDAVIHLADKKTVSDSFQCPASYFENNLNGIINLLCAMEAKGVHRLVYSSSAAVYGEISDSPIKETAEIGSESPYGQTKVIGENIISQLSQLSGLKSGILRYFNPAGAHISGLIGEDPKTAPKNLIPYVAKVALGEITKVQIYGGDYPTKDGTGVRDYIHVMDLAEGHVASVKFLLSPEGTQHTVNLGRGVGVSVLELIKAYRAASGQHIPYSIEHRRLGDVPVSVADVKHAKELLNFDCKRTLHEMCKSSWSWTIRSQSELQVKEA